MPWKRTFVVACCVILTCLLWGMLGLGQTTPADEAALAEPISRCQSFFTGLNSNNVDDAYAALLKEGPLRGGKLDKILPETKKLFESGSPYGKLRKDGIELVKAQRVGDDLALLRYVQKFENLPVVWYFTFYYTGERPNGRWVLVTVRFDHEYELLGL